MNQLDLGAIAKSFGLAVPPRVDLAVKVSGNTVRKHKMHDTLGHKKADKGFYNQKKDNFTRS